MTVDLKDEIGVTAGKIWHALSSGGPQTVAQLKKKVDGASDLLNFAIGWLAREDKIELGPEKKRIRVQLK